MIGPLKSDAGVVTHVLPLIAGLWDLGVSLSSEDGGAEPGTNNSSNSIRFILVEGAAEAPLVPLGLPVRSF